MIFALICFFLVVIAVIAFVIRTKKAKQTEQRIRNKMTAYLAHDLRSALLVFQDVLRIQSEQELANIKPRLSASINKLQSMINNLYDNHVKTISPTEVFDLQAVEQNSLAPVIPLKRNSKRVLLILSESKLQNSFQTQSLPANWFFTYKQPRPEELKTYHLVYSDIPEVITFASANGLRTVVARNTDSYEKTVLKLTRILGSL